MINQITICGVVYDVHFETELKNADGQAMYGMVFHQHLLIEVEDNQARLQKIQAILHEALHGLFHQTGHYDIEEEERIVQMLGCQLPKFLRDNPQLVALLLDDGSRSDYPKVSMTVHGDDNALEAIKAQFPDVESE